LKSVSAIKKIVQNNEGGFTGKNIEIKTFYNDPADESNYYLYKYSDSSKPIIKYYADEDTFFEMNFSISQNDDLKIGDKVTVSHYGISRIL
jgi:cell shape-determining protein MreC